MWLSIKKKGLHRLL